MTASRPAFAPVLMLFAAEAVITGLIYARLPDIKAAGNLSNAAFGVVLIGIPIGNIVGFMLAPLAIGRLRLTRVSWVAVACLTSAPVGQI